MIKENQAVTYGNKADLIVECFRLLNAEHSSKPTSVKDLAKKLGKKEDDNFETNIHLAMSELIWKGIAVIDYSICRCYRLSEAGSKLSPEVIGPGIVESSAFLSSCRDAIEWDEILDFYFS